MSKECICPDCGYTWQQGQHGGHSCATVMKKTIEEQAREIERLETALDDSANWDTKQLQVVHGLHETIAKLRAELAALKAQPVGVVLPDRMTWDGLRATACNIRGEGWNACLDEFARLNQQPASGGDDAERAACERETIRAVFLRNGFTIKEGQTDLKPYVYAAASELISIARAALPVREAVAEGWQRVPVEPTPKMVAAAEEAYMPFGDMDIALRCAMLAAPSPSREGE